MKCILGSFSPLVKERLLKHLRRCKSAWLRLRYLIVINLLNGRGAYQTADVLGVHNTTVYRVAKRFKAQGELGLLDQPGREKGAAATDRPPARGLRDMNAIARGDEHA